MQKREFIKTGLMGLGAAMAAPAMAKNAWVKQMVKGPVEFELPELGYAYNALEPYIDEKTMRVHHTKHHAGYTANFNAAVKDLGITGKYAKQILAETSKYPDTIRKYGGGFFNHKLFWKILSPDGGGQPQGELNDQISEDFGSFDRFREEFSQAAKSLFGSGWAWLILQHGKLKVTTTPNQDSPVMDIVEEQGIPLLCIDVWEHAYYLKYQNRRAEYVDAFWNIVNWEFIANKYMKVSGQA